MPDNDTTNLCESCALGGFQTPTDGRYKGRCRWCGDYRALYGQDPPLPLLQAHHRNERVTAAMIRKHRPKRAKARARKAPPSDLGQSGTSMQ